MSNETHEFEVEDSATNTMLVSSGALGSIFLTDADPSPWSFEASTGENQILRIWGIVAIGSWVPKALRFSQMGLWKYPSPDRATWHFPMLKTKVIGPGSPLIIR